MNIDKGVPITPSRGNHPKYPFADMLPGDSMLFETGSNTSRPGYVLAGNWAVRNRKNWTFTTRKEGNGYRLWRVT